MEEISNNSEKLTALLKDYEDIELAAKDEEARKRFYKEFGMID